MELISDWKNWWKFSSTWFHTAAAAFLTYITLVPDALIQTWNLLPGDIKLAIPPVYVQLIGVLLIVLGLIARVVKQRKLAAEAERIRLANEASLRSELAAARTKLEVAEHS